MKISICVTGILVNVRASLGIGQRAFSDTIHCHCNVTVISKLILKFIQEMFGVFRSVVNVIQKAIAHCILQKHDLGILDAK